LSIKRNDIIHTVKLESDTGKKIVKVRFQKYSELSLASIDFRLDSGADISTIHKKELNRLGYSMDWIEKNKEENKNIKIKLADNTERNGVYVKIPLMYFMEKDFYDFKIYIVPDAGFDYSNLLGLDVSTEFNYFTDNEDGILEFYRIDKSKFAISKNTSRQRLGVINK